MGDDAQHRACGRFASRASQSRSPTCCVIVGGGRRSGQNGGHEAAACPWRMRLAAPEGHPVIHPAFVDQRILVAEDEPLITMELGRLLEEEGATVFAARSVSQALRLVGTRALTAAIVDSCLGTEEDD